MNDWFMSYKIYHTNGGVFENFEIYGASSSKSASTVLIECTQKLASDYGVKPEQIMFISFNRV
ncbi:Uncharacterised protein [Enterobacter cloacae]|uniref:Uncharacterized protein n=2 Tax=Enterobacter cloacae TaxID=550 RepID=A0A0H3CI98_ENTCC|nr:hypothetical protein ECL_01326 [Enterobacter cloacae subsp. cloacae ATCC 13047]KGB03447.1 hypothetical protein DR74_432 [Enterobacter cloacae]ADF62735.1 hypothetical protein ECL_03200 [Enterobacter cloacae subsp. cloacae ATCC 13047]OOC76982.1 hypothetical protein BWP06_27065 [Enterobacter cloacae]CUJ39677.1 Uncharacterised protein [Enterobacter cloacae]